MTGRVRWVWPWLAVWIAVATAYGSSSGSSADWHLASPARTLYTKSAFLHGYMHGYEQGFHAADIDVQMAHEPRDPAAIKQFKEISGYEQSFGDKRLFTDGYRAGFRVGYADCIAGRKFRAVDEARDAALGLADGQDSGVSKLFDQGISQGYRDGLQRGLGDGRLGAQMENPAVTCHGTVFHPLRRSGDEFCSGYGRGFRVGYADGYVNQTRKTLAQRAK